MNNRFFIYCRKSSEQEDRQTLSLDSQEKELLNISKLENLKIIDVYKESGSAHVIGRKYFNEMIARIEKGEANSILVWDESRIARNSMDGGKIIYMIDLEQIVEIRKPGKIYTNTPDDKSWLGMLFMMTKKDSDDKGVNVKRGLKTKAEKGWLPSGAKPGYENDKYAEKGSKTIKTHPTDFILIRKAWDLMLTGVYSPPQILEILNNEWGYRTPIHKRLGGKPMARSKIYQLFTDPFYYGQFEYPTKSGNWHKGKHESMITEAEFWRVQSLLGNKGRQRPKTYNYKYTGLIRCGECEAMVTCEEKLQVICGECKKKFASRNRDICPRCNTKIADMKKHTPLRYLYYHCTKRKNPNCSQGSITEELLEEQISEVLSRIQISDKFKAWAIKYLNELKDTEISDRNAVLDTLQRSYNDVVKRIDNLVSLKISPQNSDGSLLSDDEFKKQKQDLMIEKSSLEEKLNNTGNRISTWVELTEKAFNFACYAKYWFEKGDDESKRQIFAGLGSKLVLEDKIVRVELEKPLEYIESMKTEEDKIIDMFEPTKEIDLARQIEALYAQNSSMLRD